MMDDKEGKEKKDRYKFNSSDIIVILIIGYLLLISVVHAISVFTNSDAVVIFGTDAISRLAEFIIGAVFGYVGGQRSG